MVMKNEITLVLVQEIITITIIGLQGKNKMLMWNICNGCLVFIQLHLQSVSTNQNPWFTFVFKGA